MRPFALILLGLMPALVVQAAAPYPPSELPGTLVIVGGGKLPEPIREAFVKAAGGPKAKLVVIPTASADADQPDQAQSFLKSWKAHGLASVQLLHTRDRATANRPDFANPLQDATAVWFSGGAQTRIVEAYRGTLVEQELHALLKRGGVIGGTSAGAAIMSDLMIEGGTPARTGPGLGFLPGVVVDQHFTQRQRLKRLQNVVNIHPDYVGLGIDEATAVLIKGRDLTILGEGTVSACWGQSETKPARVDVLKPGGQLDLFQLRRAAYFRSLKPGFPPKEPAKPEVPNGSLVIVGGGGLPASITDTIFELAGGKAVPVVVVPTAQEDRLAERHPELALFQRLGCTDVTVLHTRDRQLADDPKFSECLLKAKLVWFGGGRQWRFVDAYEGTLTQKRFQEVLARGGVIAGSSAGASIQSEYMPRGHPLGNTVMAAEGYERGFGFLPGCAVDQHFFARKRQPDMTGLMKLYPQYLGIGIDEATAIVVRGARAQVIGQSKVAFYDTRRELKPGEPDYLEVKSGEAFDLIQRKKIP